ncbi:MAG: flavodoxin-dependent (E)-4-hydroxy-3-methylbut-2-enyl-diphosphate synthase [Oscillospiraceae bacterium]|nr:flavodoxin-dependent (E)-4-hydroxy-3-methylbut-2-enyl-diphosphate synthase [Oscillospiraceae bacterium]
MRKVQSVKLCGLTFGGGRVYIQSMLNVPPEDADGNIRQALQLQQAGCDIIRIAVENESVLPLIAKLKSSITMPLVADIHFDYRLAIKSVEYGADKIRINPGNIGGADNAAKVAEICKAHGVPIRIGVNSGSLERDILSKYGGPTPQALVESALSHARMLERCDFYDIVLSIKSSNVSVMTQSYRLLAEQCDYPLHLGVTEAGTTGMGVIKSAIGIGSLLLDGIGETIRVSLTADPIEEIRAARDILKATGRLSGVQIISCPTCGRTKIDIIKLARQIEDRLAGIEKNITVAVMGCVVNGPGEAKEADIGIAGGDGFAVLFKRGEVVGRIEESGIAETLIQEIEKMEM